MKSEENFLFGLVTRTSLGVSASQTTVDFSVPGWHPDPPNAVTGIPDAFTFILQVDGDSKPQMCHKIQPVWICFLGLWQQGSLESETPHLKKRNTRTCLGMWLFLPNYDETTKIKYISIQLRIRLVLLK